MEPRKKATVVIGSVILLVTVIVIAAVIITDHINSEKTAMFPRGNFTVLSWDGDFLGNGENMIAFHDDDRNITYLLYDGCTEAAMWGCPDHMLTPPQMSNDCNCS